VKARRIPIAVQLRPVDRGRAGEPPQPHARAVARVPGLRDPDDRRRSARAHRHAVHRTAGAGTREQMDQLARGPAARGSPRHHVALGEARLGAGERGAAGSPVPPARHRGANGGPPWSTATGVPQVEPAGDRGADEGDAGRTHGNPGRGAAHAVLAGAVVRGTEDGRRVLSRFGRRHARRTRDGQGRGEAPGSPHLAHARGVHAGTPRR
jgi:hypothetical protein